MGAKLWLVRPLGFRVDEKTLRRAGLDYWQHLDWEVADHWDDLVARLRKQRLSDIPAQADTVSPTLHEPDNLDSEIGGRIWFFSRFARQSYAKVEYRKGDVLVFGSETSGLPKNLTQRNPRRLLRIPTTEHVRSLNLATSVGIASFEALRQFGLMNQIDLD